MCGIAGIVDLKNRQVDKSILRAMTESIAHRGPDGEGYFFENGIGLGHRRLSIIDLSSAGSQPMKGKNGSVITYNGEIYNYIELKKELKSKDYKSKTDTEVLLKAYEKWGIECPKKLNGIFAFAIWDKKQNKFFAARDHCGVKPFFYSTHNGRFYFASEIKALLKGGVPAKPNQKIIHDYLMYGYYDHTEETFFENIYELPPGHCMEIKNGTIKTWKYWHTENITENKKITDNEAKKEFISILENSVKIQLRSDVPIGMSISGGLDSSLLAAVVNKTNGGQKNFLLYHFTYSGKNYEQEIPFVKKISKRLNWKDPVIVKIYPDDMPSAIEKITWHEEQPFPGLPTVAWHKLYKTLGNTGTTVTLEGHGGDEMFAGYDYYAGSYILDLIRKKGAKFSEDEIKKFITVRKIVKGKELEFILNGLEAYFRGGISADASKITGSEFIKKDFADENFREIKFEKPFDSSLSNFQYREFFHTKLPRVLRSVDKESMAFGKELRVPILDKRLVEFAFSLPIEQRVRNGSMRFIMREAAKDIIPESIANTPKRSLPNPQRFWFQDELKNWISDILNSSSFKERPYFSHKKVLQEYKQYCETKNPKNSFHIWQWLNIELWHRVFIDKKI
ncbi:MAG: asparagine synthase (glutamine-hydrolyzing) [Candidatus Harrisonbacteria bacterium CG10_big_fil_rev_8_21_14_0_10_40_38]|uniref:asparagine synthase (glutamine-hydrolyzing) n=1 Tax=Candidatus Harrisonbacteria bacterium CG10_big_fil_rev_8_21_14_0_10_40_38 TaxID=1974583 RepID=A0A2H0URN6_9BACT|nr:MAG: asparagine synthase (glutamine-hydrolyzing) [Candidatus Harrisonbacteria bacterium CG10_big_fil_rev_8_21_14_0_10_40_38]